MPSADGQAPCLQLHRERQQSVTPSIHHLCFWFTSHYVINHSVTPSLYHQSLSHSSYLHCSLLSLFLSSTPSTLTLGSGFDWFPRPLDIFIVHVTMYLTDPLFRWTLQPIPVMVVQQSVSPWLWFDKVFRRFCPLLAIIWRVHGAVNVHHRKVSICLGPLSAIVWRVHGRFTRGCWLSRDVVPSHLLSSHICNGPWNE